MPDLVNTTNQQQGYGFQTPLFASVFTGFSYTVGSPVVGSTTYYGTVAAVATGSLKVQDYNNHAIQIFVSASGNSTASISVFSSIDGIVFNPEYTFLASTVSSSITRLSGRRSYFQVNCSQTGSVTSSVYVLSGQ